MNSAAIVLAAFLLAPSHPHAVKPKETFWQTILRITGFTALPSTSKGPVSGPSGQPGGGDLWTGFVQGGSRLRLTRDGGYQSPVFVPDGQAVLALREGTLIRVSTAGLLDPEALFALPRVKRLLAVDRESPGKVVVLFGSAQETLDLGLLDLADRQVHSLRGEAPAAEYRETIAKLVRWNLAWQVGEPARVVGLAVRPVARGSDIVCILESGAPVNVSRCGGDRCDQPSLSADGSKVVFVRAASRSSGE